MTDPTLRQRTTQGLSETEYLHKLRPNPYGTKEEIEDLAVIFWAAVAADELRQSYARSALFPHMAQPDFVEGAL